MEPLDPGRFVRSWDTLGCTIFVVLNTRTICILKPKFPLARARDASTSFKTRRCRCVVVLPITQSSLVLINLVTR
ncbi:hypothetical protein ARMSODRAFT_85788 [Armillaria solidipes]|uniref:Uncharacterized protein n=1 Tax=Armillaria solidipes TaxID=1076256 RepID=A0A2H3AYI4_9AGAR|nr:hypothetical protein ARMSODRAFT_85788 [Armillaria solidipes]